MSDNEEQKPVTIDQLWQEQVDAGNIEVEGFKYHLERSDGLKKMSKAIIWVEWGEDDRFKAKYDEPAEGRSLLMSPFNAYFTWQTTRITELIEVSDTVIKFKTENSDYTLKIGEMDND